MLAAGWDVRAGDMKEGGAQESRSRPSSDTVQAANGHWPGWKSPLTMSHPRLDASAPPPRHANYVLQKWPGWKSPAVNRTSEEENSPRKHIQIDQLGECTLTCGSNDMPSRPQLLLDNVSRTFAHDHHTTIAVDFILPDGVLAGDKVAILHEGRPYFFTVPGGARPGENVSTVLPNKGDSLARLNVEIAVPTGYHAGNIIQFQHGGHQYEVAVPRGLVSGQKFMADVSPPTVVLANDLANLAPDPLALHNDPLAMHGNGDTEGAFAPTWKCVSQQKQSAPAPPEAEEKESAGKKVQQDFGQGIECPEDEHSAELSYGVGIQFEYDRSSGALCKCAESDLHTHARELCTHRWRELQR